jgi:predicted outer membrane protein
MIAVMATAIAVAQNNSQQPGQPGQRPDQPGQRPDQPGQQPDQPGQRRPDQPDLKRANPADTTAGQARQPKDVTLASCLLIDNQTEVALAQFAEGRAQDQEVKQFAQKLAADHGEMIKKLHRFVGSSPGIANPGAQPGRDSDLPGATLNPPSREKAAQPSQPTPEPRTSARQPQPRTTTPDAQRDRPGPGLGRPSMEREIDFVSLKRELGEKCLQTAIAELEQKSGAEFDKCFVGMQIVAHLHAIDAMLVFQNHVSPELNKVLAEGIQTSRGHLQQAKDLAKRLDGAAPGAARREKTGG